MDVYQFFFKKKDTMDNTVANGPWNVEDHLLILPPWTEQPLDEAKTFAKVDFWIQITDLPPT